MKYTIVILFVAETKERKCEVEAPTLADATRQLILREMLPTERAIPEMMLIRVEVDGEQIDDGEAEEVWNDSDLWAKVKAK